ncbi:MAG TPA: DMT family transporter [Bacteroidales bacterium]|jgi:drug/metabolite transporter (DMT)-like permease|nr:DMT family transporter [Bacteroidales bacterium]HPI86589.1 DMT family transporter [Bacteroidales bacterium]
MRAEKSLTNSSLFPWIILVILAVIWGSSFILIKKGLNYFTSVEVGALRISIAFLFLLPFVFKRIRRLSRREWKFLILNGMIGSGFPAFLFAKAQTGIDSSLAGILNSLTPLFTLIVSLSFFSLKIRWFNILGVMIGLIGAIGLISISGGKSFDFNFGYAVYIIFATICYATNVNIVKYKLKDTDALTITVFSFFTIGIPILLYLLLFTGFINKMTTIPTSWEGLGYIGILAVVGTGMALIAFNKLVKIASPVFAASVTYLIPVVAVSWGMIDGEKITIFAFFWMMVILLGVFLVNKKKAVKL